MLSGLRNAFCVVYTTCGGGKWYSHPHRASPGLLCILTLTLVLQPLYAGVCKETYRV
ncbi:hypothetical protein KQQSB11_130005 [Klebsiella quasipneumoniae subsp. quasipneumoniae]|nr:hypothetical protein KQQSB11_130005 [Klebsiella quasipneumoniae subsp. quasipneumoniae]